MDRDKPLGTRPVPGPIQGPGRFGAGRGCARPGMRAAQQPLAGHVLGGRGLTGPASGGGARTLRGGGGAPCCEAAVAFGHVKGGACPRQGRGFEEEAGLVPGRLQLLGVRLGTRGASGWGGSWLPRPPCGAALPWRAAGR